MIYKLYGYKSYNNLMTCYAYKITINNNNKIDVILSTSSTVH